MPNDETQRPLAIEDVAQPWYARPSRWFALIAAAGGLIALSRRNKSTAFDSNPLQDRDEFWRIRPMSLGPPKRSAPSHEEIHEIGLAWWESSRLNYGGIPERKRRLAVDAVIQLYAALRYPVPAQIPNETMGVIGTWLGQIGPNILNLTWLFEEAKTSDDALRHLWYAIKIPELSALAPDDQRWVFEIIDSLPERERWRVKFFYDQAGIHLRDSDWTPSIGREGQEILRYHSSHIDTPSNSGISLLDALELPYKEFVARIAGTASIAWDEVHDRIPDETKLMTLSAPAIAYFDKKIYLRALRYLKKQPGLQEADRIRGAVGLMLTFGPDWKRWLVEMQKKGIDAHDATFWLPQVPSPGLGAFLRRRVLKKDTLSAEDSGNFDMIASRWNDLPAPVKRETTKNIITFITSSIYEDIRDEKFAEEAARWGVKEVITEKRGWGPQEKNYKELEERYIAAKQTPHTIPFALIESGDLRLLRLDRDDPRGLFLGKHTACCQTPGREAEACALHGMESPHGAFFAVEKENGEIIAQAWTWRNHDVVMFDNIEGPGVQSSETREQVIGMYKELAEALLTLDPSILEVRIGSTDDRRRKGYPINWDAPIAREKDIAIILPPMDFIESTEDSYTDSSAVQYILAKRADGTRFFRSPEYMKLLAGGLQAAWGHDDKDAFEIILNLIEASRFYIEVREGDLDNLEQAGAIITGDLGLDICLYDEKTKKTECSFSTSVWISAEFTNPLNLNEYSVGMGIGDAGTTVEKEKMFSGIANIVDLDSNLDALEIMSKAIDLPREKSDTFGAKYLVSINNEEFQGYDSEADASKVAFIIEAISEKTIPQELFISVLRKITEEEIEEYKIGGYLEQVCYEFQPDEWWCDE